MTEDNIIPFPNTNEAPPQAAPEPIVIRIEVTPPAPARYGAGWLFAAVCGVVSFLVVTALIG
jgi:hypothetical protein